ncbi:MAG: adenosine deaminase [Actinomycetota bacterium]|nr:adenosine deaminase [Actinomycetota bacterium]
MRDLLALPKVELHIHLEGSMRVATVRELAERNGASIPSGLRDGGWRFRGSIDFIDQYSQLCALLRDLEDFRRLAYEACEDLAANNVRYAEAVFSPAAHATRLSDWYGPIEAVLDGLRAGQRDFGPMVRLTPDVVRDNGIEDAERTLEVALKHCGDGVVGLNAAGSERTSVATFADIFRRARAAGLRSVPHAGEWAGPESVWQTLEHYQPDRIGHGVAAAEDPKLVQHLAELQIPLEVCPLSNVATGVFPTLLDHPFDRLRRAGVVVTLNSDDPSMFGAWLGSVYEAAREAWDYGDDELAAIARTGVSASFAEDDVKREIFHGIEEWLWSAAPDEKLGDATSKR